jgi:hypothetical protein
MVGARPEARNACLYQLDYRLDGIKTIIDGMRLAKNVKIMNQTITR